MIRIGEFHRVVSVGLGTDGLSILEYGGLERLLPVQPHFNRAKGEFDPIKIVGEFGSFSSAKDCELLPGFDLRDVTEIQIQDDYRDKDLHTRELALTTGAGQTLTWELFCES